MKKPSFNFDEQKEQELTTYLEDMIERYEGLLDVETTFTAELGLSLIHI